MPRQTGPLTFAQLQQLWIAVTDPGYSAPFLELGEGQGFEAFTQAFQQFERVSQAIDITTQGLFILNWSGQTAPPAAGASLASVTLLLSRTGDFSHVTTLDPGTFLVEEEQIDFAPEQGITVHTGRRYVLQEQITFGAGETGPFAASFLAQKPGAGFNNPRPDTIKFINQPGAGFFNDLASVIPGTQGHKLVTAPRPDVVMPVQIGQYVLFAAGANAGSRRRIIGYNDPTLSDGGTAILAPTGIFRILAVAGAFQTGEVIEQGATGAQILCTKQVGTVGGYVIGDRIAGTFATGLISVGQSSGAVAVFDVIEQSPDLIAENFTAAWTILTWSTDLAMVATNQESPSGGASAMLDELLEERGIWRRPSEEDESYRLRGSMLADTVSPNALLRAGNRVLAPLGGHVCLREVGYPSFRGMFFDGDITNPDPNVAFAFDLDGHGFSAGVVTGTFIPGEVVEQLHADGTYSLGRAIVQSPTAGGPLPAVLPIAVFAGVAGIWGPPFEDGVLITGRTSGAFVAAPIWVPGDGLQPRDAFKLNLDYTEFRAFFLMSVPVSDLGDFGMAFDAGPSNAFDIYPWFNAFDGYGATAATLNSAIYSAVDQARAAGVGFDLIQDPYC